MESRSVLEKAFPAQGTEEEKIRFLLRYAVLAPSVHNTQPWLFSVKGASCRIAPDERFRLPHADPTGRNLFVSIGCCIENLLVAAQRFGYSAEITFSENGDFVANISFRGRVARRSDAWERPFSAIAERRNVRGRFAQRPLPDGFSSRLARLAADESLRVDSVEDERRRMMLAELTAAGVRRAHANPAFRRELAQWLVPPFRRRKDGIPSFALRMPAVIGCFFPMLIRFVNLGRALAAPSAMTIRSAPLVCVISGRDESRTAWVRVGMIAERLMLACTEEGLRTSIFVGAIETEDLRQEMQRVLGIAEQPQFLFCAGYVRSSFRPTPRHAAKEKIL